MADHPMKIDPALFNMERLVEALLGSANGIGWRRDAEIVTGPTDRRPRVMVRCGRSFLRYSAGPRQGYFWDVGGDDFQTAELALLAICRAEAPPSMWGQIRAAARRALVRHVEAGGAADSVCASPDGEPITPAQMIDRLDAGEDVSAFLDSLTGAALRLMRAELRTSKPAQPRPAPESEGSAEEAPAPARLCTDGAACIVAPGHCAARGPSLSPCWRLGEECR